MKLSEAISLGHTLIREDKYYFLHTPGSLPSDPIGGLRCGCAIGSAAAAMGVTEADEIDVNPNWCEKQFPWTAQRCSLFPVLLAELERLVDLDPDLFLGFSVATAISELHCSGMPRLEIAALIAQIEPAEEPEQAPAPTEAVHA